MAYINFGSRILKMGMSGTDVEVLQCLLNGLPSPMSSPITGEPSSFGSKTEAAVKKFQSYFGLTVDGQVGPQTYLYLGQPTGSYLPGGPVFGSRTLSKGMSGWDVWILQNRLAASEKQYATALGMPADSVFGSKTEAAVKLFQKNMAMAQDGVVGPDTFMKLFCNTHMGGRILQAGRADRNQGYDVYYLQSHLKKLGYYTAALDGKFGPVTASAVKALQKAKKITVDGVVGPQTYYYLAFD